MNPLIICATGACTPIGTRAWQTASALTTQLSAFTRQPITGQVDHRATVSRVQGIEPECTGVDRLIRLAAPALYEALQADPSVLPLDRPIPLFLALPQLAPELAAYCDPQRFALELPRALDLAPEYLPLRMFSGGSTAGAQALAAAYQFMQEHPQVPQIVVGGVDSLCDGPRVDDFYRRGLLKVNGHSEGFIASEAAAFVRLTRTPTTNHYVTVYPPAFGTEPHSRLASQDMLSGDGLIDAARGAQEAAHMPGNALHSYWSDMDGSPWRASEATGLNAALARDESFPAAREPAAFLGEVGAAWAPLMLSLLHEMRQNLHHPFAPQATTGHGALQSVTDHARDVAAWIATWGYTRTPQRS